jgi:hypothetical protein
MASMSMENKHMKLVMRVRKIICATFIALLSVGYAATVLAQSSSNSGSVSGTVTIGSSSNSGSVSGTVTIVYISGAAANGTTDDTSAINAAISAAISAHPSKLVFAPNVTYALGGSGLQISDATDVELDCNGSHFTALGNITQHTTDASFAGAFLVTSGTRVRIHNCNFNGGGFEAGLIASQGGTDNEFDHNVSTDVGNSSTGNCQFCEDSSTRTQWHDNYAYSSGSGSAVRGYWLGFSATPGIDTDIHVFNNRCVSATATCFVTESIGARVEDNYANGTTAGACYVSSTFSGANSSNHIYVGNYGTGCNFGGIGIDNAGSTATIQGLLLVGNTIVNVPDQCISLHFGIDVTVEGNHCILANQANTSNGSIEIDNCVRCKIIGNDIQGNQTTDELIKGSNTPNVSSDILIANNNMNETDTTASQCVTARPEASGDSITREVISGNTCTGGQFGFRLFNAAGTAGALSGITVIANTANGQGSAGFIPGDNTSFESTDIKFIGNFGTFSNNNTMILVVNRDNSWNDPGTIAALETCNRSIWGTEQYVTNGVAAPTFMSVPSTTGTSYQRVGCRSIGGTSEWVYD